MGISSRFAVASVGVLLFTTIASGDERIRPPEVNLSEGYRVQLPYKKGPFRGVSILPHSLPWPVAFQDDQHTIGNSMSEYQPFGDPYFHGGCDLRVKEGEAVYAPVAGQLEAGHYSYSTNVDGSLTKYWKPWPQDGEPLYFEVAIVTPEHVRFEIHHMDRERLPDAIVALLNQGGGQVAAGTLLGHAISWPDDVYHHVHFNVISPEGVRINPEYVAPLLPDDTPPEIQGLYAVMGDGSTLDFDTGVFSEAPAEFVVATVDHEGANVYDHPPTVVEIQFADGQVSGWDFTQALTTRQGLFPRLWDFFRSSIVDPKGQTLETSGGYGTGMSLIQLPIPAKERGSFVIRVADESGNESTRSGRIQ